MLNTILEKIDRDKFYTAAEIQPLYDELNEHYQFPYQKLKASKAWKIINKHREAIKNTSDASSIIEPTKEKLYLQIRGDRLAEIFADIDEYLKNRKEAAPKAHQKSKKKDNAPVIETAKSAPVQSESRTNRIRVSWLDDDISDEKINSEPKLNPKPKPTLKLAALPDNDTDDSQEERGNKRPESDFEAHSKNAIDEEIKRKNELPLKSRVTHRYPIKPVSLVARLEEALFYTIRAIYEIPLRLATLPLALVSTKRDAIEFSVKPMRDGEPELLGYILLGLSFAYPSLFDGAMAVFAGSFILRVVRSAIGSGIKFAGDGFFSEFGLGDRTTRHQKKMATADWSEINQRNMERFAFEAEDALVSLGYQPGVEFLVGDYSVFFMALDKNLYRVLPVLDPSPEAVYSALEATNQKRQYGDTIVVVPYVTSEAKETVNRANVEIYSLRELIQKASR